MTAQQLMDPATNICFWIRYLKYQQGRYSNTTNAIAAYSARSEFKNTQDSYTNSWGSRSV